MLSKTWWALALVFCGSAHATGQPYLATGTALPLASGASFGGSYMEVWGVGDTSRYANPAVDPGEPFAHLMASPDAASQAALGGFTSANASFSIDTAAAPLSSTATSATYALGSFSIAVGAGPTLSQDDMRLRVSLNAAGARQTLSVVAPTGYCTCDGPLVGNTFSYGAAPPSTFQVDLVSLLGPTAPYVNGFDLSAFTALPVRLSTPTEFNPVLLTLTLRRINLSASFDTQLPEVLQLADFNEIAEFSAIFDGLYGVSVNEADFASNADFLAAQAWVGGNIRQITYEQQLTWRMGTLTAIPEPGAGTLMLLGLLPLLVLARRRQAA